MVKLLEKLLDQQVIHVNKTLGNGKIITVQIEKDNRIYIRVQFDNASNDIKKFEFPRIFIDPPILLQYTTQTIDDVLKEYTRRTSCEICKSTNDIGTYKGRIICRNCYNQLEHCVHCKAPVHPKEAASVEFDPWDRRTYYICCDCAEKYVICRLCGEKHFLPNRIEEFPGIPEDDSICQSCAENETIKCDYCESYFFRNYVLNIEEYTLCKSCAQTNITTCDLCGKVILKGKTRCSECEMRNRYENHALVFLNEYKKEKKKFVHITFDTLKYTPHEHIMNRVAHDRTPYADAMIIGFSKFSLVLVYGNLAHCIRGYFSKNQSGNLSMSEFKKTKVHRWVLENACRAYTVLDTGEKTEFHLWEKPYLIRAKTDRVSNYGKIWRNGVCIEEGDDWGSTEEFYIIGSFQF